MFVAYALEERAAAFVLLVAGACGASSIYGFIAGTWPFGIVEAVWTVVRWDLDRNGRKRGNQRSSKSGVQEIGDGVKRLVLQYSLTLPST